MKNEGFPAFLNHPRAPNQEKDVTQFEYGGGGGARGGGGRLWKRREEVWKNMSRATRAHKLRSIEINKRTGNRYMGARTKRGMMAQ